MNRGIRIKKNKKNFIFFLSFVFLILNIKLSNSLTILGALNKVSGKISKIKIEDNSETNFGTLKIVVKTCKKSLPEDPPENSAFIQIWDTKIDKNEEKIFSGWMFSSSPSISAVDHAVYDVWVIDCNISYIEDWVIFLLKFAFFLSDLLNNFKYFSLDISIAPKFFK